MAIVYLITNLENGKRYVGKTKGRLDKRWYEHTKSAAKGSKHAIHCAIRLYGPESFTRTILGEYATEEEALSAEISWIDKFGTLGSTGYNMCEGGRGTVGYHHSADAKEEMRAMAIAKGQRPSALARQRAAEARLLPITDAARASLVAGQKQRRAEQPVTDEFRDNCSKAKLERDTREREAGIVHTHSKEAVAKRAAALRARWSKTPKKKLDEKQIANVAQGAKLGWERRKAAGWVPSLTEEQRLAKQRIRYARWYAKHVKKEN